MEIYNALMSCIVTISRYASLENDYRIEKEDHDLQIKSLLSKHDANSEFIRQENNLALNKVFDIKYFKGFIG